MSRRSRARAITLLLTLVAFVLTHQAVFLYTYGAAINAAFTRTGHGFAWSLTVLAVLTSGLILAIVAMLQLARLSRRARSVAAMRTIGPNDNEEPWRALRDRTLQNAVSIGAAVALILTLTENAEHLLVGAPLPGLAVFSGPEYSGTVPILVFFALATAFVRALYVWRREVLVARLRAVRPRLPRATAVAVRTPHIANRRARTYIGWRIAGRAPPGVALI